MKETDRLSKARLEPECVVCLHMVTGEDLGPERQVTPFANIKEEEEEEEELEPLHLKEEEREDDIHDVVFIGVTVKSDKGNHPLIRPKHPQRLLLFDVEREEILILILKSSLSHGGLSCLDPPTPPSSTAVATMA